jgi:hypothetical protein
VANLLQFTFICLFKNSLKASSLGAITRKSWHFFALTISERVLLETWQHLAVLCAILRKKSKEERENDEHKKKTYGYFDSSNLDLFNGSFIFDNNS